jgi:hypothetical protein
LSQIVVDVTCSPSPHPQKLKRLSPIFSCRVFGRRTPVERAENNPTTASPSRLAIGHRSKDCPARELTWWHLLRSYRSLSSTCKARPTIHHSRAQVGVNVFPRNSATSGEWRGRGNPLRIQVEPLTGAANANLKASSRAQPAGVRHPLTSLPFFHLRSDLLRLFSGNGTSESQRLKSDQDGFNEQSMKRPICSRLRRFITANCKPLPPHPMYKNPSTLSHTSSATSELLFFILLLFPEPHANVVRSSACVVTVPSFVNQRENQKRHHPPGSE